MDVSNGNKMSTSTSEISNGVKDIDLNSNDFLEDEASTAPFEILAEFLSTLMARDYKTALVYCKLILQYEPNNKIVQDFYPLIQQKIDMEGAFDNSSAVSDENENSKDSDDSAEYYSSTSGREDEEGHDSSVTSLSSSSEDDSSL